MDALSLPKNRRLLNAASAGDPDPQDYKKGFPKKLALMESEQLALTTSTKNPAGLEIPSLDDMTSYLISNESIGKELLSSQVRQSTEVSRFVPGDNEYEETQTLSTRTRDKSDSSIPNQSGTADEVKKEIESLFKKAQILCSAGEYQQAINLYNRIITLNEKSGPAWVAKGHCYGMLGQDAQALVTYEQALKMSPSCQKDEQLWYGIGVLYQKAGELSNAEISFRNALRLEPKINLKAEVLQNLGSVLKAKGEYAESIKMFNNAILTGVFPPEKMIDILCQNGNLQEKINDLEGALKTYQYALIIQDSNLESLLHAGWLCFKLDKIDQSLSYMTKAEALSPADSNITYVISRCHLKLKQHTVAYEFLHKAITKSPTNSTYWASLGILFSELLQLKQAHESFSKALTLNPTCPENFFNLGCLFELSNQLTDAISMYDKAIEIQPTFLLAVNRRRKLLEDTKITSLEVQFKHPPFTFPFPKEPASEKNLPFPQPDLSASSLSGLASRFEGSRPKNKKEVKEDLLQSKAFGSPDPGLDLKPVRLDLLASKLGPQKASSENSYKDLRGSLGPDVSSLTFARPKVPEPSGTKLPSVQSLSSSLGGLNSFSILQNNFNNVNNFVINPIHDYAKQLGGDDNLLPSRAKTDDTSSGLKSTSGDLAKQLSGLQAILSKTGSSALDDNLKATKNISSPIVLKHNPHLLGSGGSAKRIEGLSDTKSQFRSVQRVGRTDNDDDEPLLQKKLKIQTFTKSDAANPPAEN